jgi:hypothetical protein
MAHCLCRQSILPPWVCHGVAVDAADIDPLVGMRLLDGYELTVQAIVGGQVLIKALP